MILGRPRSNLYAPAPVEIEPGSTGEPRSLAGVPVHSVREDWLLEDGWWSGRPLRRRYFELVLTDGRDVVVFRDLERGGWYEQRA